MQLHTARIRPVFSSAHFREHSLAREPEPVTLPVVRFDLLSRTVCASPFFPLLSIDANHGGGRRV